MNQVRAGTVMKYVCHRSGEFQSESKGVCNLKTQGTKKIDGFCPTHIYKETKGTEILVRFLQTHVGHENELCYIQISPSKKNKIASRLVQNVSKRNILNDIRDSYSGGDMSRFHSSTIKDIANIKSQYKIEDYKRDSSDGVSVNLIVDEKKLSVLFYKPQDTLDPNNLFLKDENFVLILMSDAQAEILKESNNCS